MRTTEATVKAIIDTGLEDNEITPLIALANRQITNTLGGTTLASDVLTDIETWLTAHYIAIGKERQTEEERVQDLWVVHQGKFGEALRSTTFGQMVITLDTTGLMENATKQKASITAIPQDPDSATHDA